MINTALAELSQGIGLSLIHVSVSLFQERESIMAHFYGTLDSNSGQSTRCGSKGSGMVTQCASWAGAVQCTAYIDGKGVDCVKVEKIRWKMRGERKLLYDGPISEVQKGQTEAFGKRDS